MGQPCFRLGNATSRMGEWCCSAVCTGSVGEANWDSIKWDLSSRSANAINLPGKLRIQGMSTRSNRDLSSSFAKTANSVRGYLQHCVLKLKPLHIVGTPIPPLNEIRLWLGLKLYVATKYSTQECYILLQAPRYRLLSELSCCVWLVGYAKHVLGWRPTYQDSTIQYSYLIDQPRPDEGSTKSPRSLSLYLERLFESLCSVGQISAPCQIRRKQSCH